MATHGTRVRNYNTKKRLEKRPQFLVRLYGPPKPVEHLLPKPVVFLSVFFCGAILIGVASTLGMHYWELLS